MIYFNNCQKRPHSVIYEREDAIFDLNTTTHKKKARNITAGAECIVAIPSRNGEIDFNWYRFKGLDHLPDREGDVCRVIFGDFIKSETLSKHDGAHHPLYSNLFNKREHFKQVSVLER